MEAAGSPDESPDPKGEIESVLVRMTWPGRVVAVMCCSMVLTYLATGDANTFVVL